ncbi:uncharacterized protein LOC124928031 [Impatiens glandulifera]|uniref:uncharacterized protein LOC124928031 n=1 Tax=Impatiens glandulifera TaxID=253017 RepID=UPI001FB19978|nr:uncharacterized protein LOC124928031 [Impatiens glandulifera]
MKLGWKSDPLRVDKTYGTPLLGESVLGLSGIHHFEDTSGGGGIFRSSFLGHGLTILTSILSIAHLLHHGFTEATTTFMNLSEPKGISDNGDIIDCVNIYKQISFDNPFIKSSQLNLNLEKQMKRDNSFPKNKLVQGWHRNGECPFQTVPIIRSFTRHTKTFQKPLSAMKFGDNKNRDHAVVWEKEGAYLGASAKFSISNPQTQPNDFSLAQIRLLNGMDTRHLNSIQAGWTVHPLLFGDYQTRFFTYWTGDNYNRTGCYNLQCEGFVQTSRTFAIGSPISISSEIKVSIFKEYETGDWWLELDNELIGYWPRILFSRYLNAFNSTISKISWGGEVYYKDDSGQHTATQMGNGQFPGKGAIRASHVRNLQVSF